MANHSWVGRIRKFFARPQSVKAAKIEGLITAWIASRCCEDVECEYEVGHGGQPLGYPEYFYTSKKFTYNKYYNIHEVMIDFYIEDFRRGTRHVFATDSTHGPELCWHNQRGVPNSLSWMTCNCECGHDVERARSGQRK